MSYTLLYFASLADQAGRAEEVRDNTSRTPRELYAEVAAAHGFTFSAERLRVAINGVLVSWDHLLGDGDEIVFLPPVSGG